MERFCRRRASARDITFAWSADTVGQGWGINTAWGGLRMYETMRLARPDFFIHTGDTIYADSTVPPEIRLPDGTMWRNVVTDEKSKVAETLDEFRGNYTYNLLDDNVRRFNREIPQLWLWDDHEVKNNWYPGMSLDADDRYTQKDARVLAANARQAFLEYSPMRLSPGAVPPIYRSCSYGPLLEVFAIDLRTYRGPNTSNRQTAPGAETVHAGAQQLAWLKSALRSSTATWKVIASDLPIGLVVRDGTTAYEAIANADAGPPLGRELEIADLLRFMQQERIRNVIWVTGDVHYAAAHHYDPQRARFKEFDPFWEFVAGPLHAITGGAVELDSTFGPEERFNSAPRGLKTCRRARCRIAVLREGSHRGKDAGHDRVAAQSRRRFDLCHRPRAQSRLTLESTWVDRKLAIARHRVDGRRAVRAVPRSVSRVSAFRIPRALRHHRRRIRRAGDGRRVCACARTDTPCARRQVWGDRRLGRRRGRVHHLHANRHPGSGCRRARALHRVRRDRISFLHGVPRTRRFGDVHPAGPRRRHRRHV